MPWWHLSSVILIILMSRCHVTLLPGSHLTSHCHIFQLKWELWQRDPAVTCPAVDIWGAPGFYQSQGTGDPRSEQKKKGDTINCKIWPPPPPPPTRYLSATSRGLIGHNWDPRHVSSHVSVAGAKFGLNIPRPLTRQPSIPGEMPAPYEEWATDPSSLRTNDWSVPPRPWIIFSLGGGYVYIYNIHYTYTL